MTYIMTLISYTSGPINVPINSDPTKQANDVLFSWKKVRLPHPHLVFNRTVVSKVSGHKHPGLILESGVSI